MGGFEKYSASPRKEKKCSLLTGPRQAFKLYKDNYRVA